MPDTRSNPSRTKHTAGAALMLGAALALVPADVRAQVNSGPVQQVIAGPGLDIDPALSPDGATIAYASSRGGSLELWMRALGGGALYQLTTSVSGSVDRSPRFTPDGRSLVFQSDRVNGTRNIWSMALATRALAQLTNFTSGGASHPDVSADGKTICFTHTTPAGDLAVWLMTIDGRDQREVTAGYDCAWTPDGRIVFARSAGSPQPVRSEIWIIDANGQREHVVSSPTHQWTRSPAVSRDGKVLVYTSYYSAFTNDIQEVSGGFQINPALRTTLVVIPLGGQGAPARELVSATSFNSYACVMRDGKTLLFTSTRSGSADIWSTSVTP